MTWILKWQLLIKLLQSKQNKMNKKTILIGFSIVWVLIAWVLIGQSFNTPVSELNKQIDQQEQLVSAHCGICNASKINLESLYGEKRGIMSGFTLGK